MAAKASISLGVLCFMGAATAVAYVFSGGGTNMDYVPRMADKPVVTERGPLYVQAREVTVAEWNRCHEAGACTLRLRPPRGGEADEWPATGLNWQDVNEYVGWINSVSGHRFRLPTAQEWYAMAEPVLPKTPDPIFTNPALSWASEYLVEQGLDRKLHPSGSWSTTAEGIADLDGNVWEWTQDCYVVKGSARDTAASCPAFVVGGEHKAVIPFLVRDPARGGCAVGAPPPHLGMRLVTEHPLSS
jgi:formylglycine-generating enzyme required for sulfatase activity